MVLTKLVEVTDGGSGGSRRWQGGNGGSVVAGSSGGRAGGGLGCRQRGGGVAHFAQRASHTDSALVGVGRASRVSVALGGHHPLFGHSSRQRGRWH